MGDKGGKKSKRKNQQQCNDKHEQKRKTRSENQQKDKPTLVLPK